MLIQLYIQFFFISILILIWIYRIYCCDKKEGFSDNINSYVIKDNFNIYDNFYINMYDKLYIPSIDAIVICKIFKKYKIAENDNFLIISISGNIAAELCKTYKNVYIMNNSVDSITYIKSKYNKLYKNAIYNDITLSSSINNNSISYMYFNEFEIYLYDYDSRRLIFENISNWLLPNGLLFIHLLLPESINAVIPASQQYVDFQKYSTKKILESEIVIGNYVYNNKFDVIKKIASEIATTKCIKISEKFLNKNTQKIREYNHILYTNSIKEIIDEVLQFNFYLKEKIIIKDNYKYIYVFQKSSSALNAI